jgi:hypothetical protein
MIIIGVSSVLLENCFITAMTTYQYYWCFFQFGHLVVCSVFHNLTYTN